MEDVGSDNGGCYGLSHPEEALKDFLPCVCFQFDFVCLAEFVILDGFGL